MGEKGWKGGRREPVISRFAITIHLSHRRRVHEGDRPQSKIRGSGAPTVNSHNDKNFNKIRQELSYRKEIARQLRTQYVEGIYDNPVTLKSRLTITQGHWKRNH